MPSRRTYLAAIAGVGTTAALGGCSTPGNSESGPPVLGEAALAQRNARPIPANESGDHRIGQFNGVTIDYDALASRLTEEQRRSQLYWHLDDSPVDDVTRFQGADATQSISEELFSFDYAVTEGDVDREAVRSRYGLPAEPSRRHRGFDCYGGPDADLGIAVQSVAVSDDVLVTVGEARRSGETRQVDGLDYAIELATAEGSADGWIGDAFDAATPAHEVNASYRIQNEDEDTDTVDLSTVHVRDSEVVSTEVHAHESSSVFEEAFQRRDPEVVLGHQNVTRSDVETRDRMAIWRQSESHEAFFSEDGG